MEDGRVKMEEKTEYPPDFGDVLEFVELL